MNRTSTYFKAQKAHSLLQNQHHSRRIHHHQRRI